MRHIILIAILATVGCSGTIGSALGPVLDPASIIDAAGVATDCAMAETVTIAPAFEVDWSSGGTTYGGGVFIGCASRLFQFRCTQEKAVPPAKPVWKCEPLSTWTQD
jgi:hypothetical protein